ISTYVNGVELDRASVRDSAAYEDSGVNWRIKEGYAAPIAAYAKPLPIAIGCVARVIDHSARTLRIETSLGTLSARAAVSTVPTATIAEETLRFTPALFEKTEAAAGLPLGLADKAFLSLADGERFPSESRIFGRVHELGAANYHLRPFGRPVIEVYFGGKLARELEKEGRDAFGAFAMDELVNLVGGDIRPNPQTPAP